MSKISIQYSGNSFHHATSPALKNAKWITIGVAIGSLSTILISSIVFHFLFKKSFALNFLLKNIVLDKDSVLTNALQQPNLQATRAVEKTKQMTQTPSSPNNPKKNDHLQKQKNPSKQQL